MAGALGWFFTQIWMGFVNFFTAVTNPSSWLDWSDKEAVIRFIYYGASIEFLFVVIDLFLVITVIGLFKRKFLWLVVRIIEGFSNGIGRFFAWAGLIMVLQQVMIVFLQRIFRVSEISIGPFGAVFTKDLSWFGEELKLYNAMVVALVCAYTFVQGGHVRVDLFYSRVSFRFKRGIDMFGSLFFIMPTMFLIWLYGWFFMWRHLVTPKFSASESLEKMMRKASFLKENIETIGFSPNGFNAYFLFKVLLVSFALMMIVQGIGFFYRSMLEMIEGPESEGKHLDKDKLNDELAETVAAIH
ncbi:MAG: C4-dicarboxylate ABC transporter permease [Rhodobacteraceae bacterium]|nr:C4-dicarboxylate ABC transporter permease [Paracoccaceae bacterium]